MSQFHEITLFGEIRSKQALLAIAELASAADNDRDTVRDFEIHLAASSGVIRIEDFPRRGNPFLELKAVCRDDDIGWKETIAYQEGDAPHTVNTWMKGFGREASITLGRGGIPTLTLPQLEAGLWGGPDVVAAMVRDLRRHSLIDVDLKLTVADGLCERFLANPEPIDEPLFALG